MACYRSLLNALDSNAWPFNSAYKEYLNISDKTIKITVDFYKIES